MESRAQKIAEQIKNLVDELVAMSNDRHKGKQIKKQGVATTTKGAIGALTMLTEEGFFDTPKDISAIMEKLKEIGRYYPKTAVSMNLLNLQRRKVFSRLKNKDTKKYEYVLRK